MRNIYFKIVSHYQLFTNEEGGGVIFKYNSQHDNYYF